jgi:Tfp pilus assembly protein PilF
MEMNRPGEAEKQFVQALERTPGRPKAIYGLAESAQAPGDNQTAAREYSNFLRGWKDADQNLPEIASAKQFLLR